MGGICKGECNITESGYFFHFITKDSWTVVTLGTVWRHLNVPGPYPMGCFLTMEKMMTVEGCVCMCVCKIKELYS